jgi:hypothetical protein
VGAFDSSGECEGEAAEEGYARFQGHFFHPVLSTAGGTPLPPIACV